MTHNHSKKRYWFIPMIIFLLVVILGCTQLDTDSNKKPKQNIDKMEKYDVNAPAEDATTGKAWKNVYKGGISSRVNSIHQTSDGGYIATGYIDYGLEAPEGFNNTIILYNEAAILLRIDKDGNKVWEKSFGGLSMSACSGYNNTICTLNKDKPSRWLTRTIGRSVQQTSDGGYVIVGDYHTAKVTDDPKRFQYDKGDEVYLVKTDEKGNIKWKKTYGEYYQEYGYDVQETSDKGFFIVGATTSYGVSPYTAKELGQIAPEDIYLLKTDANGNILWKKVYGGIFPDMAFSGQQTSDGGYIIAGITASFGRNNTKDGLLDLLSLPPVDDENLNLNERLKQANKESIYTLSVKSGLPYYMRMEEENRGDIYLLKIDSKGSKVWEKTFGTKEVSEIAYSVQETLDGGYILVGQTYWPVEPYELFNNPGCWPHEPCDNSTPPVPRSDVYLIKTDANGNKIWEKSFGGEALETYPMYSTKKIGLRDDIGYSVQQTSDGGFIISGFTRSVVHRTDRYDKYTGQWAPESRSTYLVKTDSNGDKSWEKVYMTPPGIVSILSNVGRGTYAEQTSDGGYIIAAGQLTTYEEESRAERGHAYIIKTDENGDV